MNNEIYKQSVKILDGKSLFPILTISSVKIILI